jgi:hypothetical protein
MVAMTTKEGYGKHYRTLLSGTAISAVLVASMLLFAHSAISQSALGQQNQTSASNQTASQANQTASQANQTAGGASNQTASQANQTAGGAANKTGGASSQASQIKPGDLKKLQTSLGDIRTDLQSNNTAGALKKLGNADSDLFKLMNKKPSSSSDKGSSDKGKSKSSD